jgi:hypothetical protein
MQDTPSLMGHPVVTGAVAPREDGEAWPPGLEPSNHMAGSAPTQDGHSVGQATLDPSTPTKDGATPDPSDATPTPREAARRLAHFTKEV